MAAPPVGQAHTPLPATPARGWLPVAACSDSTRSWPATAPRDVQQPSFRPRTARDSGHVRSGGGGHHWHDQHGGAVQPVDRMASTTPPLVGGGRRGRVGAAGGQRKCPRASDDARAWSPRACPGAPERAIAGRRKRRAPQSAGRRKRQRAGHAAGFARDRVQQQCGVSTRRGACLAPGWRQVRAEARKCLLRAGASPAAHSRRPAAGRARESRRH